MLRTHFQRVELDAVGHHQRNRVAATDPEAGQAGRDPAHVSRVLPPGHRLGVARGAKRDSIRVDRRVALKCLAQRGRRLGGGFRIAHLAEASPGVPCRYDFSDG